ncbi:MAG: hypothetical protein WD068_02805 [Candidatus Babeliales bacterium]
MKFVKKIMVVTALMSSLVPQMGLAIGHDKKLPEKLSFKERAQAVASKIHQKLTPRSKSKDPVEELQENPSLDTVDLEKIAQALNISPEVLVQIIQNLPQAGDDALNSLQNLLPLKKPTMVRRVKNWVGKKLAKVLAYGVVDYTKELAHENPKSVTVAGILAAYFGVKGVRKLFGTYSDVAQTVLDQGKNIYESSAAAVVPITKEVTKNVGRVQGLWNGTPEIVREIIKGIIIQQGIQLAVGTHEPEENPQELFGRFITTLHNIGEFCVPEQAQSEIFKELSAIARTVNQDIAQGVAALQERYQAANKYLQIIKNPKDPLFIQMQQQIHELTNGLIGLSYASFYGQQHEDKDLNGAAQENNYYKRFDSDDTDEPDQIITALENYQDVEEQAVQPAVETDDGISPIVRALHNAQQKQAVKPAVETADGISPIVPTLPIAQQEQAVPELVTRAATEPVVKTSQQPVYKEKRWFFVKDKEPWRKPMKHVNLSEAQIAEAQKRRHIKVPSRCC